MSEEQRTYIRFGIARRIEHLILILSFTTLAVTGLIQKYALNAVSLWLVSALGGIASVRVIHRVAATVFVLEGIYHFVHLGYLLYVQKKQASMMPGAKDVKDAWQSFLFNLGFKKQPPKMPHYNFSEKVEYLAMLWGFIAMSLTGFMLWNPIATTRILPGVVIPAAKAAHGLEAVLAVLAILLWHFYNVHIKHWNWSMIRGTMTRHQMEEEHGEELEELEAAAAGQAEPAEEDLVAEALLYRKRMRIFLPISIILTVAMVAAVIFFVTFEESAITTIEPVSAEVEVYDPRTPTPRPIATAYTVTTYTWKSGISQIFQDRCAKCHGDSGGFSVESYEPVMQGADSGPAVIPGNPHASPVIQNGAPGSGHDGAFTVDELTRIFQWIRDGAQK